MIELYNGDCLEALDELNELKRKYEVIEKEIVKDE
jgi:hypothetical protein